VNAARRPRFRGACSVDGGYRQAGGDVAVSADSAFDIEGVRVLVESKRFPNPKQMPEIADRLRGELGDPSVVVLGSPGDGRGRDTMAQAGGREPGKLPEALATPAPRSRPRSAPDGERPSFRAMSGKDGRSPPSGRVVALDYGSARCGVRCTAPRFPCACSVDARQRRSSRVLADAIAVSAGHPRDERSRAAAARAALDGAVDVDAATRQLRRGRAATGRRRWRGRPRQRSSPRASCSRNW
jgi:RNase H-fold protein (predicted Holliday junction resolvase)